MQGARPYGALYVDRVPFPNGGADPGADTAAEEEDEEEDEEEEVVVEEECGAVEEKPVSDFRFRNVTSGSGTME